MPQPQSNKLVPKAIYSQSSLSGHSCKWTAPLTAALTKPCLNSSSCVQTLYLHIPVSGQLQLRTLFLLPEGVRLRGACTVSTNDRDALQLHVPFNISCRSEQNMFQNTCALTSPTFSSVGNLSGT